MQRAFFGAGVRIFGNLVLQGRIATRDRTLLEWQRIEPLLLNALGKSEHRYTGTEARFTFGKRGDVIDGAAISRRPTE
jgi:hypothetical protein